jgi:hypothetical protein
MTVPVGSGIAPSSGRSVAVKVPCALLNKMAHVEMVEVEPADEMVKLKVPASPRGTAWNPCAQHPEFTQIFATSPKRPSGWLSVKVPVGRDVPVNSAPTLSSVLSWLSRLNESVCSPPQARQERSHSQRRRRCRSSCRRCPSLCFHMPRPKRATRTQRLAQSKSCLSPVDGVALRPALRRNVARGISLIELAQQSRDPTTAESTVYYPDSRD